jgi:hypothetical protein
LMRPKVPTSCIAIFHKTHQCVADVLPTVKGLIVNIVMEDVKAAYDDLYMEGLDFYKELGTDINGKDHFVVLDPNGILVNVHAPLMLS